MNTLPAQDYRLLGIPLRLEAPSPVIDRFNILYRPFIAAPGASPSPFFRVQASGGTWQIESPWGTLSVQDDQLLMFLTWLVQDRLIRQTPSHYLLHAGSLEVQGKSLLLCAPSSVGKTTLTFKLIQMGAGFLSDEIAAVDPQGQVHAFPRSVGLREGSLELLGLQDRLDLLSKEQTGELKYFADPSKLFPMQVTDSAPLHRIVFLEPPDDPDFSVGVNETCLEISLSSDPALLREALAEEPGVQQVIPLTGRPFPTLRIIAEKGLALSSVIDRLSIETGTLVCGHYRGCSAPLTYEEPPKLERLDRQQGLKKLMAHVTNFRELGGSTPLPVKTAQLASACSRAHYYRLVPGPLEETAALLVDG